jgi:ABC-type dipeptide/oligopeptide/nickel transport system permease subunit
MGILGALAVIAIFAPWLAPYPPGEVLIGVENVKARQAPCIHLLGCPADQPQHIMGIDGNVRDEFSRVLYGARLSLVIGFTTVTFAIIIGTVLGALAGYLGGWVDNVIMRFMDVLLAFPSLLLAIAIVTILGPGLINALLAIGIVSIPAYARVVRSAVLSTRDKDFVQASRSMGGSTFHILFGHVLPNSMTPLIVQGTLGIATAILDAAGLSFLGLGAQPPTAEWGSMLSAERNQVFTAPYLVFYPGLAIILVVLSFNLLGDGLRDALDPSLAMKSK